MQVKVKFPSKTIYKDVSEPVDAAIVRNLICGTSDSLVNTIWTSKELQCRVVKKVEKQIQEECSGLCSRKTPSILAKTSPKSIINLKDKDIVNELEEKAPVLYRCLLAASSSQRGDLNKIKERTVPAISMAGSVLLRCRNPSMAANAYRLSVLLWHGGAQKQLYKRCSRWGICMSHWRMLKKIDEFGKDFDKLVCEWKANLEHSCRKEQVLSTINEVVEEAELEIIPEGMETINVADLGLSFTVVSENSSCDHVSQDAFMAADASLTISEIKGRVHLKMGSKFDEHVFNSLADEIAKRGISVCSKALREWEEILLLQHPPTFQITGDNLDLMVKVKHMSSTNRNNSIHWFNLNAVKNRVLANHLPNDKPRKSVLELENVDFLPSHEDNEVYLHNIAALATRVVVKNIPALSKFQDIVVKHIPHTYSEEMKETSEQLPLGLLFKNENVNEEMLDILQELHDKYLPTDKQDVNGVEVTTILERLFFGGDQLTDERAINCKDARSDGDTEFERLEGFMSKVEDWHAIRILYQVLYDIFFKSSSASDIGTMCSNMNVINNCNAKTTNVLDNFNVCKDFINMETDALITAAAMSHFGMESLDDKPETFIPPDLLKAPKDKRRVWLHSQIKNMLAKFVMSDEHATIREKVAEASRPKDPVVHRCRVCCKQYKYAKAMLNHERKVHPDFCPSEENESQHQKFPREMENGGDDQKPRDDRFQYATLRLAMGLLLRNFDDAVKEGDGERIFCCWKFAMLIYKAHNHNKYALASLRLQAFIKAMLTPREAECLKWNRTVNNKGGAGNNISMDIRMEHLICLTKELLKHLGPNLTEAAAKRCSKAVGHVSDLIDSVDEDLRVERPKGHHKMQQRETDFRLLLNEFHHRGNMFKFNPGPEREYRIFANFRDSLIKSLDLASLNRWISQHKKELQKMEAV